MREKLAEAIYFIASTDRDQFIDEYTLDIRKSRTWDELPKSSKEYWREKIDPVVKELSEKIEKGLLTNEEIRFLRDAANVQENKLLLGNTTILSERAVAQAQLQNILALLK